jgi:GTP cyclohydrolase I
VNLKKIRQATRTLLDAIEDDELVVSTLETPGRVARAFEDMLDGYTVDIQSLFTATEDGHGADQLVIAKNIQFTSFCCHHLLPFQCRMSIGYLPRDRVIGISKLGRVAVAYGHRLQLQERLTRQVADAIMKYLDPLGVAVVSEAEHDCMRCRGVKLPTASIVVSEMQGAFREDSSLRAEFLMLIK